MIRSKHLFDRSEYGARMGLLAVPLNIVTALAPVVFATLMERVGVQATLWVSLAASLVSLGALTALARHARPR